MSIRKILYPVDLTGTSTANRIENEYITIGTDKYRAFTLSYAPFFADSLTLKERNATSLLKEGTDYEVLYFFTDLTKLAGGKRICGVVCITNTKVGTDLVAGYNTVGGHYANCASIIQQAIFDLNLDNRETYWQSVIDKPDLFQPTPHIHDIGDVYGLEFQIDTLIAIREAIMVGDNEVHAQILARIDEAVDEFKQYHAAHLADVSNSHKTTAHQVGTYTKEEIDDLFMQVLQEFADLEPRFKTIADEITDIYSKINAVNSALKGMSDRLGLAEQELSKFVLLLSPINQTLALLQGQIDNINLLISALQAKDKNLQDQIDALDLRLDAVELRNTQQDTRLDNLESKTANHDLRLGVLETWKIDAAKTLVDYDVRLDDIETKNTSQDTRLASLETWKTAQQTWDNNIANSVSSLSTRVGTLEAGSNIGELVKSGSLNFPMDVDKNGSQFNSYLGTREVSTGWKPVAGAMYMIVVELSGLVVFSGGSVFGGRGDTVQHNDITSAQYADSTSVTHPENGTTVTNYMVDIPDRTSLSGKEFGLQLAGSGNSMVYGKGYTGSAICSIMLKPDALYIKPIYTRSYKQTGSLSGTYKIYKLL